MRSRIDSKTQQEIDIQVAEKLSEEEFKIRSLIEAEHLSKKIAEEIKAVLRKYGASLAEWNHNLYIVPPGFQVYSVWNFPYGVQFKPSDVGLHCARYDRDYRIVKPFPDKGKGE